MINISKIDNDWVPRDIISVLQTIEHHKYEAFIVGGAIRDRLLNRVPLEFDIATNAPTHELEKWFHVCSRAGKKFGSISIKKNSQTVEITTYRSDHGYENARHPNQITHEKTIHKDLSRRDFTINALAYSPLSNTLIDHFGGHEHITQKKLVCIGNAIDRFMEDMLRPFRCFRFMAQLGFTVSTDIRQALLDLAPPKKLPSMARIRNEMDRLLMGPYWHSSLQLMQQMGWWETVIGEAPSRPCTKLPHEFLFRWAFALSGTTLDQSGKKFQFSKQHIQRMRHILDWDFDAFAIDFNINSLCVESHQLMELGFKGPSLGKLQSTLVHKIRMKELSNSSDDILNFIQYYKKTT